MSRGGKPTYDDLQRRVKELERSLDHASNSGNGKIFRTLFSKSKIAMELYNQRGVMVDMNKTAEKLWGQDKSKLIGSYRLLESERIIEKGLVPQLKECFKGRVVHFDEITYFINDPSKAEKRRIIVKTSCFPTYDKDNSIDGIIAVHNELTELHAVINLLKEKEKQYRGLHENVPLGLFRSTTDGHILSCNPAMINMFGCNSEQEFIEHPTKYYYVKPDERRDLFEKVSRNGVVKDYIVLLRKINGDKFWASMNVKGIKDKDGNVLYLDGIMNDISLQLQVKEELVKAKEDAERSDKLKTAFLSNMSHEIRTPMNAILGFTEFLSKSEITPGDRNDFIRIIHENGDLLLKIIDDILDVAKIEAGELKLVMTTLDLNSFLQGIYNQLQKQSHKMKKSNVKLIFKNGLPENRVLIKSDPDRLRQIFANLHTNAMKFTSSGSIETGYTLEPDNMLKFYVTDTGIGIPNDKHRIIFERFRQVDESPTKTYGGAGIGLTITKNLVNLLGGEIFIESYPDSGTTFYFTHPYEKIESWEKFERTEVLISQESVDWSDKTILIAEDLKSNYDLLETMLEKTSVNLLWAKNGKEAVNICQKEKGIDLILMDIRMPVMGGYVATSIIKAFKPEIRVIAQTAHALSGEKEKALNAGCDDYITKPFKADKLLEVVGKNLNL